MLCKNDFEYVVLLINDYINTLPTSSKLAVAEKAQVTVANIERVLTMFDPENMLKAEAPTEPTE